MKIHLRFGILFASSLLFLTCAQEENIVITSYSNANVEVIASGFQVPWAIEVIEEEEFLFTDRLNTLYYYKNGDVEPIENIPQARDANGFGGLMDVSLHPEFESNGLIYIAYVGNDYRLRVARFELHDLKAENLQIIYTGNQFSIGSRIEWDDNDHFFLSYGVGGDPYPEPGPQDLNDPRGKIHRFRSTGQIPTDNPVFDGNAGPTSVWSYGHRNPQGLYWDQESQRLYAHEHGPLGGDEFNEIQKGGNYGWPLFSYGVNYDNTQVSDMNEQEAAAHTILPIKAWGTDFRIAPSGLTKAVNSGFDEWNGTFLIGALNLEHLISYNEVNGATRVLLSGIGRVRDIAQLPSGNFLICIDQNSPDNLDTGRILKLTPK